MAAAAPDVLTPELLARLVTLADAPAVAGIAVLGSAARGEASVWSDIDVESTVTDAAAKWDTRPSFVGDRLVMSHAVAAAEHWAQLAMPDKAIWAAPAYADMRILVDRDGELERLQDVSRRFDYASLEPAATAYIRRQAPTMTEYVFKIRDGLERRDESKVLHAAAALTGRCERLVSVGFLVAIPTENSYYRIIQAAAGPTWTKLHRAAFGLDGGDAFAQATAAARLFGETIRLLEDRLDDDARGIVARTLRILP